MPAAPLYSTVTDPPGENLPQGWRYDEEKADEVVKFIAGLNHGMGDFAGEPFGILPWQEDLTRRIYGTWVGDRRAYRQVGLIIPSGSGKTTWSAALLIWELLNASNQSELIGLAKDARQASRVINIATGILREDFNLRNGFDIRKNPNRIIRVGSEATFTIASKDIGQILGSNPSFLGIDELAVVPEENIQQALTMAAKQRSGWSLLTTTAAMGDRRNTYAYGMFELIKKISKGEAEPQPDFLGQVFMADESLDWRDESSWYAANPSLGVTLDVEIIRAEAKKAEQTDSLRPTFECFRLDRFVEEMVAGMFDMSAYDKCGGPAEIPDGATVFGGLDIASVSDLASYTILWADGDDVVSKTWAFTPQEGIALKSQRDGYPYERDVRDGLIIATPGATIQQDAIEEVIYESARRWNLTDVSIDPWNTSGLTQRLEREGITLFEVRAGFASMTSPSKSLQKLVLDGHFRHNDNKLTRWMALNCIAELDAAGNIKPSKSKSPTKRIDSIVSNILALDGLTRRGIGASSAYEDEDLPLWA